MSEGDLARFHQPEADVVPEVVLAGHERDACRRAERHYMRVLKSHPGPGHAVNHRSPVRRAAVRPDHLVSEVVGHDQDDVGASFFFSQSVCLAPVICQRPRRVGKRAACSAL